ncbi:MAG: 2Fe-2S iron-sulfur cluster-binding protein [Bacillota bacterium]
MSEVKFTIDGREITAPAGEKLLWVALKHDIYIPHLCGIQEEQRPGAGCRLCFVEVEGQAHPVTSCTLPVREGMAVKTRTPAVDRLVRSAFELLLSDHRLQCGKCPKNRACALQQIARERGLKLKLNRLKPLQREFPPVDDSTAVFACDRSRCVLCGQCVWADQQVAKVGAIGFSRRGLNRTVSTFTGMELADSPCTKCGLCVEACPVGALYFLDDNWKNLQGGQTPKGKI